MDSENCEWLQDLQPFLDANATAKVLKATQNYLLIGTPWNDASVSLFVHKSGQNLIAALNSVYLPPQLSAIWHKDTQRLEFIWSILPHEYRNYMQDRVFTFRYLGRDFKCAFGPSSDRLLEIGAAFRPAETPGASGHRNLTDYRWFMHQRTKGENQNEPPDFPSSFWINDLDWNESAFSEFAQTLNFYMRYFDRSTPTILLHREPKEETYRPRSLPFGSFPAIVAAKKLHPYLLTLWSSADTPDSFKKFVYSYQILEFSGFHYLARLGKELKQIISAPESLLDLDDTVSTILDKLANVKPGAEQEDQIRQIVQERVNPKIVWDEIGNSRDYYERDTAFEGDFKADALVKHTDAYNKFEGEWHPRIINRLMSIRNALVHSRHKASGTSIAPTDGNYELLRPWATLIYVIAQQVIIQQE